MIGWAIMVDQGIVIGWRSIDMETMELLPGEYFLALEDGPPPPTQPSAAQAEAAEVAILEGKLRQANLQVTAIQGRVDTIDYLINGQDEEDPDYMEPTPEEIAELPVRRAQLKTWNSYRAKLGRVTSIAGWYQTPTYPIVPEPYTSESFMKTPQSF